MSRCREDAGDECDAAACDRRRGRIARYDGLPTGVVTGISALVLAAVLAVLGAWLGSEYNVFATVDLPSWFSRDGSPPARS